MVCQDSRRSLGSEAGRTFLQYMQIAVKASSRSMRSSAKARLPR